MYKIAYRIMACKERQEMVNNIINKLKGLDVKVFYDDRPQEERKGTYYTQLKCINDIIDKDYTHLVLLQDDILLVNDFDKCIKELINYKPFDLWTLFCSRIHTVNLNEPYAKLEPPNTWGQGNIIPLDMLKNIMEFRKEKMPKYIYDDGLYWIYCSLNHLPTYTTRVALMQHLCPSKSLLGYNNKNKISKLWIGEDIYDKVNWKNYNFKKYNIPEAKGTLERELKKYGNN